MTRPFEFSLLFLTIAASLSVSLAAKAQQSGNLTVEVNQLRNQEGNVCLKLFSGSQGFPNDDENALQNTCVPIAPASVPSTAEPSTDTDASVAAPIATDPNAASPTAPAAPTEATFHYTFENLPYGSYAVAIYHDRNGDQRLNRGLFGMPEEGYGFSNDAPASFGPADFDDAVFVLENSDATIQIKMRYP